MITATRYLTVSDRLLRFFIGLCLMPSCLWASAAREDSLLAVLQTQANDSNKVLTYNALFKATFTSEPLRALSYGQQALQLAKDIQYASGVARLSINLGVWHSKRGNYDEALRYYGEAQSVLQQTHDASGSADCEMNIGNVHYKMGDYEQALRRYQTALDSYRTLHDTTGMLSAVNNLGSVYKEQGHFPEALTAYMAALKLRERLNDPVELGLSCANVGLVYQLEGMLGPAKQFFKRSIALAEQGDDQFGKVAALTSLAEIYLEEKRADSAQSLLVEARDIAIAIDDQYGLATTLLGLASLHQSREMPESALQSFESALAIFRQIGRTQGVATALKHIGALQLQQGELPSATTALLESLRLSDSLQTPDLSRDNHLLLSRLYAEQGMFEAAYLHQGLYQALNDSLYSTQKSKQISEVQARYEAAQQQEEINRLNLQATRDQLRISKSSTRSLVLLAVLVAGFLVALLFLLRHLQRRRHQGRIAEKNLEIQQQRDLLESQNLQIKEINVSLEKIVEQRTQAMRNAKQELDTFLYESAHALRRPLLRIQGLEDLIEAEQDVLLRTRLRGQLRVTLSGMDELLHKLIHVSESGRSDLRLETVHLRDLVLEVGSQQPMADSLTCDVSPDDVMVTDAYLMKVLLTVVMENAFRFLDLGRDDQAVRVAFVQEDHEVKIMVQDNGSGIAADHLPHVCEMFFRGPNHRGGNGLGLFIAAKIVDKLHGSLDIQSAVGEGTTVTILLPRHDL